MGYKFKNRTSKDEPELKDLIPLQIYIPKNMFQKLEMISAEREIPKTRLAAYAIFNELELGDQAFTFRMDMPDEPYINGEYAKQASLLMNVINLFKNGISLDFLVMGKEMAKIFDVKTLMLAYRELLENEMVYEIHPSKVKGIPGKYHKDFIHVMPVKVKYGPGEIGNKLNGEGPLSDAIKKSKK